jgi:hypothetical protein
MNPCKFAALAAFALALGSTSHAQAQAQIQVQTQAAPQVTATSTDNIVKNRLRQIALGNAGAVREEMPSLMAKYRNDAGIEFLNASLLQEPSQSNAAFERVARNYSKSQWADDAQWRVVQHYALKRDTARARTELQNFRRAYPNSEFLLFASEIVKSTVGLPASAAGRPASANYLASAPSASATGAPAMGATASPQNDSRLDARAYANEGASPEADMSARSEVRSDFAHPARPEKASGMSVVTASPARVEKLNLGAGSKAAPEAALGRFSLQVGVFSSEQNAAAEVQKLIKARMRADVVEKNVGGQPRFAVVVGDYSSRAIAEKARSLVQKYTKALPIVIPKPATSSPISEE